MYISGVKSRSRDAILEHFSLILTVNRMSASFLDLGPLIVLQVHFNDKSSLKLCIVIDGVGLLSTAQHAVHTVAVCFHLNS